MASLKSSTYVRASTGTTTEDFNVQRYRLYRQILEEYEKTSKIIDKIGYDYLLPQSDEVASEVNLSEELKNLEKIYGPLDTSDALMPYLHREFVNSKADLLTQVFKETEHLVGGREDPSDMYLSVLEKSNLILNDFRASFCINELETMNANPYSSWKWKEVFVIPRKLLTSANIVHGVKASYTPPHQFVSSSETTPTSLTFVARELDGLGCYDPRFAEDFNQLTDSIMGKAVLQKLSLFFRLFSFGISTSVLNHTLNRYLNYEFDAQQFGFRTLATLCSSLDDICFLQNSSALPPPLKSVFFPASLHGFIGSMENILFQVWHKFVIMLAVMEAPVLIEDTFKLAETFIGVNPGELSLTCWGFDSVLAFVEYCIRQYKEQNVYVIVPICKNISRPNRCSDEFRSQLHVIHGSFSRYTSSFTLYEDSKNHEPTNIKLEPCGGFLDSKATPVSQVVDLHDWVTDSIQPGQTITCCHGLCLRPSAFGLVQYDFIVVYRGFRKRMTRTYESLIGGDVIGHEASTVSMQREDFITGALVAVLLVDFWRRAVVVKQLPGKYYRLYLVDGAAFVIFHRNRIFKLLKEFTKFPAMGILCKLDLGSLGISDERERKFRHRVLPNLKRVHYMEVTFCRKEYQEGYDHPIWVVQIHRTFRNVKGKVVSSLTDDLSETAVMRRLRKKNFKFQPNSIKSTNGGFGKRFKKVKQDVPKKKSSEKEQTRN